MKCPKCNQKLESVVKVINYKGRSSMINALKCTKCNHTYTPIDETEKARLNLNPSLTERIKSFFSFNAKVTEAILKGKVL